MDAKCAVRIESVRPVYADNNHNAFTDLCRFRDDYYLTFRSCPEGHGISSAASIVVLRSKDAQTWEKVHMFSVPDRDTRDPHLLVFKNQLFVYTGTWLCHPENPKLHDLNEHLGYAVWTSDGVYWQGPRSLEGTYGHYVWRAAAYGGKAYLCGRRKRDFAKDVREEAGPLTEAALLESDDGLVWKTAGLFANTYGDETAFLFEPDGSILAVMRNGQWERPAIVCKSKPPYREWTHRFLDRNIGGPMLAKWGERYLVGGRRAFNRQNPKTALYWLVNDTMEEIAELPSGGDTSYPGFVQLSETRGLVSYYSSHECAEGSLPPSAIYLAELCLA